MFANRRRLLIGVFFSLMLVVVVGFLGLEVATQNTATVTGFTVAVPIAAGATVSQSEVRQVQVKQNTDFSIYDQSPVGQVATHALVPGDLLRASDLTSAAQVSEVAIFLSSAPAVSAGNLIDIYTTLNDRTILLAKHVPVVGSQTTSSKGSAGTGVVIQVPVVDEAYWITLSNGGWALSASLVASDVAPGNPLVNQNSSVLAQLSGLPQATIDAPAESGAVSAAPVATAVPTPTATPTPGP